MGSDAVFCDGNLKFRGKMPLYFYQTFTDVYLYQTRRHHVLEIL